MHAATVQFSNSGSLQSRVANYVDAAHVINQTIPGKQYTTGNEIIITPDQFELFNRLLGAGEITIGPAKL